MDDPGTPKTLSTSLAASVSTKSWLYIGEFMLFTQLLSREDASLSSCKVENINISIMMRKTRHAPAKRN